MPVPIVAPMPNIESWNSPIDRDSSPSPVSVPLSAAIAATGLRRRTCSRSDAIAPRFNRRSARAELAPGLATRRERGGHTVGREYNGDPATSRSGDYCRCSPSCSTRRPSPAPKEVADARRPAGRHRPARAALRPPSYPLSRSRCSPRSVGRRCRRRNAGRAAPASGSSPMPVSMATTVSSPRLTVRTGPRPDVTPLPDLVHARSRAGPTRERHPVYVDPLPPCADYVSAMRAANSSVFGPW